MSKLKKVFNEYYPLVLALVVFLLTITVLLLITQHNTQGHLIYALDDPYIHMAISKNLVQHGIWGINPHEFASSSSSLLWGLLISLSFVLFGINEITPFILNILFGLGCIIYIFKIIKQFTNHHLYIALALLAIVFLTPLPSLVFAGQEHIMQIFLSVMFTFLSAKILSSDKIHNLSIKSKDSVLLSVLSMLLIMARFEGMFLVFAVCVLMALKKKLLNAFTLGIISILPVIIFGIISINNGWFFLPNSVLLKGNTQELSVIGLAKFIYHLHIRLINAGHIQALLLLSAVIFVSKYKSLQLNNIKIIMLVLFVFTTFLHMLFAEVGWFFRYEAYLVVMGILALTIISSEYLPLDLSLRSIKASYPKYIAYTILIGIGVLPLAERGRLSLVITPEATKNIYQQQYQMADFLKKYYKGQTVAANDVGAISYLADINCLDLFGLASIEVGRLKMAHVYNTNRIDEITKKNNASIAILHDSWFTGQIALPRQWVKIAEWEIPDNVICGDKTVSFYSIDTSGTHYLQNSLVEYSKQMNKDIKVRIFKNGLEY